MLAVSRGLWSLLYRPLDQFADTRHALLGNPAGVRCVQLDDSNRCQLFGHPSHPTVCGSLKPVLEMCGEHDTQAMRFLTWLETNTQGGVSRDADESIPPLRLLQDAQRCMAVMMSHY